MGTKKLVERIKEILCVVNTQGQRYDTAWLRLEDDLTGRERYVVHVKAEHQIDSCAVELRSLTQQFREQLEDELKPMISRFVVYNSNEYAHCMSGDLVLFEDAAIC